MQRIETEDIITYLLAQPSVSALLGTRIYTSIPKSEQAGVYLFVGEITEKADVVDANARLEFRFMASDDNTTWKALRTAERAITDLIAQVGKKTMAGFVVNDVVLEENIFKGYDDKSRKVYIRDYTFYYLS